MKLEKNEVIKDVEENLISDYMSAGWKIHKETKKETKPKKIESKEETDGK